MNITGNIINPARMRAVGRGSKVVVVRGHKHIINKDMLDRAIHAYVDTTTLDTIDVDGLSRWVEVNATPIPTTPPLSVWARAVNKVKGWMGMAS